MTEKHIVRNSLITGVVSGLILAVLLSVKFRSIFFSVISFVVSMFTGLMSALGKKIETPAWLLLLLCLLALPPVVWFIIQLRKKKGNSENTYTNDRIFEVVWHWVNSYQGLASLYSLCPYCQTELLYHEQRNDWNEVGYLYPAQFTQFVCEKCKHRSEKIPGDHEHAIGSVKREIRRRFRTEEWKSKTEQSGQ